VKKKTARPCRSQFGLRLPMSPYDEEEERKQKTKGKKAWETPVFRPRRNSPEKTVYLHAGENEKKNEEAGQRRDTGWRSELGPGRSVRQAPVGSTEQVENKVVKMGKVLGKRNCITKGLKKEARVINVARFAQAAEGKPQYNLGDWGGSDRAGPRRERKAGKKEEKGIVEL